MAYNEPYGAQNYARYPPQNQQYHDGMEVYNPYDNTQPHQTYDQGGYGYHDTGYGGGNYGGGYSDEPNQAAGANKERERSVFDDEAPLASRALGPKSRSSLKRWRYEHQGNLWTGGSRIRCFGRFFCCTVLIFLFLFISIILSLALWIRPPNIDISDVMVPTSTSAIQLQNDGVTVNLGVNITVDNPNYFSVKFDEIKLDIIYPVNNLRVGGGSSKDVDIKSNKQTNFTLPFALTYSESADTNFAVLRDIAGRCGLVDGAASQNLDVRYKITLAFKVLFIPIKPSISNSFSFPCPLSSSQIDGLLKSAGIDPSSLLPLLMTLA
ncbi:hypothetical protein NLI96_g11406 [Meripilus lineatus]|uniref:Late embryogenesis abundant protein LEA-2 subgroup domain-containing protein n=1 Tax=Meripilus lineatus TaxID=2056292 RepID=A0AAD5UU92_9APHY|nr:hypothetical protein NLI96_g11406 [Physisporinus lineatus]